MPYAIVQKSLKPPAVDQLARAFRALPTLTDADAAIVAKDAFGILVRGLELADAGRLLQALCAEGVEADMVDHKQLPPLPPPKRVRRAECLPDVLAAYDQLGRRTDVEWGHVILIAAGSVLLTEFRHIVREVPARKGSAVEVQMFGGTAIQTDAPTRSEHSDREEHNYRCILELFLDVAPGRLHIAAEKFNFAYLGDRLSSDPSRNYVALVQDCLRAAPQAVLNRGALAQHQDASRLLRYPSKHAFEEESTWLLWRHFASGSAGG